MKRKLLVFDDIDTNFDAPKVQLPQTVTPRNFDAPKLLRPQMSKPPKSDTPKL